MVGALVIFSENILWLLYLCTSLSKYMSSCYKLCLSLLRSLSFHVLSVLRVDGVQFGAKIALEQNIGVAVATSNVGMLMLTLGDTLELLRILYI